MRIAKRMIAFVLALAMLAAPAAPVYATEEAYLRNMTMEETLASSLKALGLFKGVSEFEFELEREPTRAEALVMLIRLLGAEDTALNGEYSHPFKDTADYAWADKYIAYAYEQGLTTGQSEDSFGGTDVASAEMYLTFVLRALGYTEGKGGDFKWDKPFELAEEVGILPEGVDTENFLRGDVVLVSYAALNACLKGKNLSLARQLAAKKVFSFKELNTYYDASAIENGFLERSVYLEVEEFMLRLDTSDGIDTSGYQYHSSILQVGDAAFENYGFYQNGAYSNAQQIKKIADKVAGKARVFSIIAPNALGVMLSDYDFGRLCRSVKTEAEGIAFAYESAGENVIGVDVLTTLRAHNDEYLYYRTDHHWSSLGAYYAYCEWARAAGFEPTDLENDYIAMEMGDQFGMFYGWCGNPKEMTDNPDQVTAYLPKSNITTMYTDYYGNTYEGELVKDYSGSGDTTKYLAFIGGDRPLTTITNHDIDDDSACVLVKGSYGNPFAAYLTQHYHTVYVIDYRHYSSIHGYLTLSKFVDEKGVDDIIFLVALTMSQSDGTAHYMTGYCK